VENTSPSWNPSWFSYDGGKMDNFVAVEELPSTIDPHYHRAMGYYNQDDLPYYYELASQFATSDRFFESVMAGTIPNRMYLFTATSFGHIFPDPPPQGGFPQKTFFRLMNEHGVNWRYYYQDNSIFLGQFSDWSDPAITGRVFPIDDWYATLADPQADSKLPSVIFIEHAAGTDISTAFDEHPGTNTQQGVGRVKQILDALMKSDAWKSSVFIITYDEYGGLYDHVPIQAAPAPDGIAPIASPGFETPLPGDFAHTGFRIPIMVISPWVKPHYNSRTVRETTSILKLIEFRFGLPALTARDAWADNMIEFFDFSKPAWLTPPSLPAQPTNAPCDFSLELNGQQ
jgi:phospholipase C